MERVWRKQKSKREEGLPGKDGGTEVGYVIIRIGGRKRKIEKVRRKKWCAAADDAAVK